MVLRRGGCARDLEEEILGIKSCVDNDVCCCDCHATGAVHTISCCHVCIRCNKRIAKDRFSVHQVLSCPPSILSVAIERHARYADIIKKADEIVKGYDYTVTLAEEFTITPELTKPQNKIVLIVNTHGTFPGILILNQLNDEIAQATGISEENIGFSLFPRHQEPTAE
ncbi:MAG: hypothetical protein AAB795_01225 [Patescibacteria group bacterium]